MMKHTLKNLLALIAGLSLAVASPARPLPRALPDTAVLSQSSLLAYYDSLLAMPHTQLHGVMVLQHGRVVGEMYPEPFGSQYRHTMYSCSKTLVGIGVMLAHEEGLLPLEAPVLSVLRPALGARLPAEVGEGVDRVRVADLLEMSSGWNADWGLRSRSLHWLSDYLSRPLDFEPGSCFEYDSMVSYLLSATVQAATGRTLYDYLEEKLFRPLNIQAAWEQSPEGISCGGWGLYLHLESMAKIGQMLLGKGEFEGRRILSESSVAYLSACRRTDTWGDGYGSHVWCFKAHPGAYRADGAYGQYIVVLPEQDMVVAITQCSTGALDRELELIWRVLLHPVDSDEPIPATAWRKSQRGYRLVPAQGDGGLGASWLDVEWDLEPNPLGWSRMLLCKKRKGLQLCVTDTAGVKTQFALDCGRWKTTATSLRPLNARPFYGQFSNIPTPFHVAGSYGVDKDSLLVRLLYVDWLTGADLRFRRDADGGIRLDMLPNYGQEWIPVGLHPAAR